MDEQELNKKLAEWAGLKDVHILCDISDDPNCLRTKDDWAWVGVPKFTQSLDACFKCFVPDNCSACFNHFEDSVVCLLTIPRVKGYGSNIYIGKAGTKEDALALCLAIEKLIDEEAKR